MLPNKHNGLLALENVIAEIIILIFWAKFSFCYFISLIEFAFKLNSSQDALAPSSNTSAGFYSEFYD